MSRTLFSYIFKDLLRVFIMTAIALAAIMSFGGLLRPLTKHGLDLSQVISMLIHLLPAMMTYSLPVAALFATTMVYGRLSADNEITAARAAGISYFSLSSPALLLGLVVAIVSLLFLCLIVPTFTLGVERVVYSNIARLVANNIERSHEFSFKDATIYADQAILPTENKDPTLQIVKLIAPTIITYTKPDPALDNLRPPREFYTAKEATAFIREHPDGKMTLEVKLDEGFSFPRDFKYTSGMQIAIGSTTFGPLPIPSAIRENTKFMDIFELKRQAANPERSRSISELIEQFRTHDQKVAFVSTLSNELTASPEIKLDTGYQDAVLKRGNVLPRIDGDEVVLESSAPEDNRSIEYTEQDGNTITFSARAHELRISAEPDPEHATFKLSLKFRNVELQNLDGNTLRSTFPRELVVPMPESMHKMQSRSPADYLQGTSLSTPQRSTLLYRLTELNNNIQSEIHARVSFAMSCLILVAVGYCLGIMFRSGNFLSAFAVSVIPALLCVTLIVAGQHMAETVPTVFDVTNRALRHGLLLIWAGNAVALAIGIGLMWRLQRQ